MSRVSVARKSYLALVHHPVYDRHRKVVATSITNLDIHDIARSSRTYELAGYFLVHPVTAQRELADRITRDWGHWQRENSDAEDEPTDIEPRQPRRSAARDTRGEALSLIRIVDSVDEAIRRISGEQGRTPLLVATSARQTGATVSAAQLVQEQIQTQHPMLLLFGTGWGLTDEVIARTDRSLEPIYGPLGGAAGSYNHLSVRSAAGIILDRLFGRPD